MTFYLKDIPLEEAKKLFQNALNEAGLWGTLGVERLNIDENCVGRVLAEPVWALNSYPHYHSSAMDGFVLRSESTIGADTNDPVFLEVKPGIAKYVDTGDPIPSWADLVIPIELVEGYDAHGEIAKNPRSPKSILIRKAFSPWSHIRHMGEDIVATQLVLPAYHKLRAVDLGAIIASGNISIDVFRKPSVAIIPTGDELVKIGKELKEGDIIEFNSIVLAGQILSWGGIPERYPIIKDDFSDLCEAVNNAANMHDLVLINAGSSAGSEDYTSQVVEQLGDLLVHGIAIRPGHPVIMGTIKRQKEDPSSSCVPIIGVPGYPVSAALTGEIFVKELLYKWQGIEENALEEIDAVLSKRVVSPAGDDDYIRVVLGNVNKKTIAAQLPRGAGAITSMVKADGITVIPRGTQVFEAGQNVKVKSFGKIGDLNKTIFAIGSHDVSLDILAQYISKYDRRLISSNVGSLGGLIALNKGECHMCGTHLLDPAIGDYNVTYVKKYIKSLSVIIVSWLERQQGLIVKKGNPKHIIDLHDLIRDDIVYINRQKGAGTRVLLDYHLSKIGIDHEQIKGYDQEEYTHLSVAADVMSGRADCGLGIAAAAHALNLDFIPLYNERYDLVIPTKAYNGSLLEPLLDLMNNDDFKNGINKLPGYNTDQMGKIIAEI